MSLDEIISTSETFVFTSFLSQAKNTRSEFIDDEFILQPRKESYWPVAQHLLTLCNSAWARMCVCVYVCVWVYMWDTSSFLKPAGFHYPRTTRWTCDRSSSSREINSMNAGAFQADSSAEVQPKKRGREKDPLFHYNPKRREPIRTFKKEEMVELSLNSAVPRSRNDIQPKVSTGRASVINLPRSSFGSGEIIVQSRNSQRRPGRPLPRDYINAVSVSRRLRIGRCSLPFPCRFERTCGMPRGFSRVSRERRCDHQKNHSFSHLGEQSFRAPRVRKWKGKEDFGRMMKKTRWRAREKGTRDRVLFKFEDPRGWPSSVAILQQTSFRSRLPLSSLRISYCSLWHRICFCVLPTEKKDTKAQRMLAL